MTRTLIIACLLIPIYAYGQSSRTRYGVWVTPVGKNQVTINGLAVGLIALPRADGQLRINGLNVEILPIAIFTIPGSMVGTVMGQYSEKPEKVRTIIHGVSISGGIFEEVEMHGFSLNLNSYVSYYHGVEMSLIMNSNHTFSGAQLSMWGNRAVMGKGLQIGFFNSCDNCKVVQIGFLNRIGNRVIPLVNLNLKKRTNAQ